jgi:hypothetical protein
MVRQQHVTRHGHVAAADQPDVREGVMRGAVAFASTPLGTGRDMWQKPYGAGCRPP